MHHGLRQNKSKVSNLLELLDYITKLVDSGNCVAIDCSKAFDKILRNKLLFKLSKYSVTEKLFNCIRKFPISF